MRIQIDVKREDGKVTQLTGCSGMAVCMEDLASDASLQSIPIVSLRCNNEAELAWNLAALMAAVEGIDPTAFETALVLRKFCDTSNPIVRNRLDETI